MKAILFDKKIVSLENIKSADATIIGSGTYKYCVLITYFGGETTLIKESSEEAQMEVLKKILKGINSQE